MTFIPLVLGLALDIIFIPVNMTPKLFEKIAYRGSISFVSILLLKFCIYSSLFLPFFDNMSPLPFSQGHAKVSASITGQKNLSGTHGCFSSVIGMMGKLTNGLISLKRLCRLVYSVPLNVLQVARRFHSACPDCFHSKPSQSVSSFVVSMHNQLHTSPYGALINLQWNTPRG